MKEQALPYLVSRRAVYNAHFLKSLQNFPIFSNQTRLQGKAKQNQVVWFICRGALRLRLYVTNYENCAVSELTNQTNTLRVKNVAYQKVSHLF